MLLGIAVCLFQLVQNLFSCISMNTECEFLYCISTDGLSYVLKKDVNINHHGGCLCFTLELSVCLVTAALCCELLHNSSQF